MTLYIDADACPVKSEAERVAQRYGVAMVLVCNGGIRPPKNPLVTLQVVGDELDAADNWIAERAGPGDIVVTDDVPLADRVIKTGANVVQPNGEVLNARNIGARLATRDLMTDMRAADPLNQSGGKAAFSKADRARFLQSMDRLLQRPHR
ncbi:MAG: YaiI/YqxD family protein [Pseudomonadota bacterium]